MEEAGIFSLNKIVAPKLEDAGLEDCALSPESIKQAFLKAANSIRSSWGDCVGNPESSDEEEELTDALIRVSLTSDPPGQCGTEKGDGVPQVLDGSAAEKPEEGLDNKVLGETLEGGAEAEGKACVDGLQGLKIGDGEKGNCELEKAEEWPILTEGYV
ncbi:hypothetical protein GIB67_011153 [Kingdonia uniflora]|uniref:Uncharacterized protein n=1 Tax=Kingdonia uniflora TaxID=39325 RepID=A0A7J7PB46_9MAGN|nr:hypothetical protein GIB67_011153 [Kingdonia uniflora]